jgi:CheY-like chemotaxis protein
MRPKRVVLCVDDDEKSLSVRVFLLETRGYRVLAATNAEDALALYRTGPDLVVIDLVMPRMDGNEFARHAKEIDAEVPILIISDTVKSFDRARHADAFLPKGHSVADMLERIRVMVARKRGPKPQRKPVGSQDAAEMRAVIA